MTVYRHHIRFTVEKITSRLKDIDACIYRERIPLDVRIGPGDDPDSSEGWKPIRSGEMWGGRNQWAWFKADVTIPASWAGRRVGLFFALGHPSWRAQPEALVYVNGELRQGVDGYHHEVLLTERAAGGEVYHVALRAWCTMFDEDVTALYQQIFWAGDLVQIDLPTRHLYHSVEMALGTVQATDPDRAEYHLLLNALDAAFQQLDLRNPASAQFYESVPKAQAALDADLSKAAPLPAHIVATGHAHIDVLWRWRLENTREKVMHTFGNILRLMEQYPKFHFTQSQPQLYQYAKENAPELYEQIKARVKEGRWEPTGGLWVEVDCNIPSGESLVRQILLGRTFFRDEFGTQSPVLWLPDTFGYSWALPQLIKRSGMKYFMTSKISWSQYNRLPYDSFLWRGIDGTEVVTHFLTAPGSDVYGATYNATLSAEELVGTWTHYQQKDRHDEVLTTFGHGDGGGGPTIEMLERAERARSHPGLPQVEQGSATGFFERLEADSAKLPTWNGELYLEYHRGTYTTQARSKRANRNAEVLYHRAEAAAAIATLVGKPYPRERLNEGWRLILLHQFHDIIPGSSIREVYEDSMMDYERVTEIGEAVLNESIEAIAAQLPLAEGERALLLLKTTGLATGFPIISIPAEWLPEGMILVGDDPSLPYNIQHSADQVHIRPAQSAQGLSWQLLRFEQGDPPSLGYPVQKYGLNATPTQLENRWWRITLNDLGEFVSLYYKEQSREIVPEQQVANQLQAFEDRPMRWDAWDIDAFYEDKMWLATPGTVTVIENGPLRATVEVKKRILSSEVTQRISLDLMSERIDFRTHIDWRERHVLLKVAFPVNILSPRATFDIQFGNVERPTHRNTSWDWARFESVGHKWVNIAEGDYGISLLNDCKYGYDVHDNVLRLSLLRSPTFPDPDADQGIHEFTYSLYPDINEHRNTIAEAYDLNNPVMAIPIQGAGGKQLAASNELLSVNYFVIIETVKGAEDGRGLIVRLYETYRQRVTATLECGFPIAHAYETDLMEEDERELEVINSNQIELHFTPFQIRTLRLIPA